MNYHPPFIAPSALDERHIEIRQWCYVVVINDSWSFSKWCTYADKTCPPFPYIQGSPFPTFMPFLSAQPRSPRSFSWGIPSQTSRGTSSCCEMQGPGTLIPWEKKVGSLDWKLPEVENTATFLLITHRFIFWLVCTVHSSLRCLLRVELGLNCTSANRVHWQCRNLQAIHVTSCNIPYKIS
jgi:hypothetical protein